MTSKRSPSRARTASRARRTRPRVAATRRSAPTRAVLRARDLMTRKPVTVPIDMKIGALCDLLQERNINGAPVVDSGGRLVGVVTQEDIIYGSMGHPVPEDAVAAGSASITAAPPPSSGRQTSQPSRRVVAMLRDRQLHEAPPAPPRSGEKPFWAEHRSPDPMEMLVGTIMTSPAISAEEDTPVSDLCRIMWSLRIHRVPILKRGRVTGLVSAMDLCRGVMEGKLKV